MLGILYESFMHPLTILLSLPPASVGALLFLQLFGFDLSMMAIIGPIMLIGIVKKNAIVMIDFAVERMRVEHKALEESIYEAALLRFRPIMMTTMAAIFGTLPIAIGMGAGSDLRQPLGIAVVGGLVVSQALTLFTVPVFSIWSASANGSPPNIIGFGTAPRRPAESDQAVRSCPLRSCSLMALALEANIPGGVRHTRTWRQAARLCCGGQTSWRCALASPRLLMKTQRGFHEWRRTACSHLRTWPTWITGTFRHTGDYASGGLALCDAMGANPLITVLRVTGSRGMLTNNLSKNTAVRKSSKKPLAGRRILLAEDEGLIALELERILEDFGCDVVGPLASVDEVLQRAQRGGLDGALLDVNLRGQRIFEILPTLQKLGLRLIITSGYDDCTLFPAQFRSMPRIAKPFDERELRRVCEKVFANPATQ